MIEEIPSNTSKKTAIYISGDFEGWTGGQETYKLSEKEDTFFITLPKQIGSINYKFTQGSWNNVETDIDGNDTENRTYVFDKKEDTVKVKILNWTNLSTKKSSATNNVFILSNEFNIPQLDRKRRIWVYLPPDYENSNESYPVLYMHDGQNVFDTLTSFAGEWEVDETLNKLYKEKDFKLIVIAIDNGGENRMNEYSPWINTKHGGGEGKTYIDFLIKTLKPFVDENYRTKTDKENTVIMGSSMGGLISHYAGLKYPEVFGKIGVFSPSFWFSKQSFELASQNSQVNNLKMYFLIGKKEGANMVSDMEKMIGIMKTNGFNKNNIAKKIVPEAGHNEKFWRNEFEEAILWLFNK